MWPRPRISALLKNEIKYNNIFPTNSRRRKNKADNTWNKDGGGKYSVR